MAIFKGIDKSETSLYEIEVHKKFSLDSNSSGINSIQYRSGSLKDDGRTPTVAGSYWNSLLVNFYLSGSSRDVTEQKFNAIGLGINNSKTPQYRNKFNPSGSVIFIPQQYFGEKIKRESFTLTSGNVTLKDDGYGNLYSTTTTHVTSTDTSISSSVNYKGNVFYNLGVISITDTGSYGGNTYTDLTTGSFTIGFDSTHTIYIKEYAVTVNQGEFNSTSNPTIRALTSGSGADSDFTSSLSPYIKNELTASGWSPYMTTIGFYNENAGDPTRPMMVARYPQPVKMRDDVKLIFKVRMDY